VHWCRDSYAGMALLLEMMSRRRKPLSELCRQLPHYESVVGRVPCGPAQAEAALRRLIARHAGPGARTRDGLRLEWADEWILIRPSNTEPLLRLFAEAPTRARAQALLDRFTDEINAPAGG